MATKIQIEKIKRNISIAKNKHGRCPVCGQSLFKLRHNLGKYKYLTCMLCSATIISPFPTPKEANKWYLIDDYYANPDRNAGYEDYGQLKEGLIKTYMKRNRTINAKSLFKNKQILEIGCGLGYYPETLEPKFVLNYTGLDLNKTAIKTIRKKGYKGLIGDISALPEDAQYDIVIMFDLLEHILEPNIFLSLLKKRMRPKGKIILTTPSTNSVLARIAGKKWVSYIVPQHVILYNPKALDYLFLKNGFKAELLKTDFQWVKISFLAKRINNNLPSFKLLGAGLNGLAKISDFKMPVVNGNMFCMFILNDKTKMLVM